MLKIREDQMSNLTAYFVERFVERMVLVLRRKFPEEMREMAARIDIVATLCAAVARAATYGITDEGDVERFLEYTVEFGGIFGDSSRSWWAKQFLDRPDLSGTEKLKIIDDYDLFVNTLGHSWNG